jgi:hypothetical protein
MLVGVYLIYIKLARWHTNICPKSSTFWSMLSSLLSLSSPKSHAQPARGMWQATCIYRASSNREFETEPTEFEIWWEPGKIRAGSQKGGYKNLPFGCSMNRPHFYVNALMIWRVALETPNALFSIKYSLYDCMQRGVLGHCMQRGVLGRLIF